VAVLSTTLSGFGLTGSAPAVSIAAAGCPAYTPRFRVLLWVAGVAAAHASSLSVLFGVSVISLCHVSLLCYWIFAVPDWYKLDYKGIPAYGL
jgi:hypothetical protein